MVKKMKGWWMSEGIIDEYGVNDRRITLIMNLYTTNDGVLFTIDYNIFDEFDNTVYCKTIFKSKSEVSTRRMFKHYTELLETMKHSKTTYDKYYKRGE